MNLESEVSSDVKRHLDQYGGAGTRTGSQIPDFAKEFEEYNRQQGMVITLNIGTDRPLQTV